MLGLCGSLSLPSLLLPRDPVTRRRLYVRGAFTAATRESIQICVWAVCVLLVLSEPSNFTVAIRAFLLSSVTVFKKWRVQQQQRQYPREVSEEQSRAPTQRAGHERIRKERHGEPSHTEKSSNTTSHGGPSVCAGQPSRGAKRQTQQGKTDRQIGGEKCMDGCRQEALTIHMAREQAATPRRNTGEKGERGKDKKQHNTHKRTNCGREKQRHGPRPGRQLHTSPLTHTDTIAVPSVRG
ncbi:hypothetical protein TCSYLVIO_007904 [Trypanosoma cruzi]|nr:hypothetical protein TCSYLVIO_007904 [Trypanosoma cruzi]